MSVAEQATVYPLAGARRLSEEEIELANAIKAHAERTKHLIAAIEAFHVREVASKTTAELANMGLQNRAEHTRLIQEGQRWRMRATDTLSLGYMELVRSVTRKTDF